MRFRIWATVGDGLTALVLATCSVTIVGSATAQQPVPWGTEQPPRQPLPSAQPPAKASKAPPTKAAPAVAAKDDQAAPRSTEGQLRQRVEQLEEQLADMQVTIGTLESLGKGGGGGAAPRAGGGTGGVDQARIDSLETQIRALTAQVEQLSNQLRQSGRRGDAGPIESPAVLPAPAAGFGQTTVTPGRAADRDPIGRILSEPASASPDQALPQAAAAAGNPKELYETAYGYLLQQDYGAAEVAFEEFLRRYPNDRQAPDAQYWYGETLYVQRRYKPAGQAFLRVIEKHQASAKVPNSLLKLAMSLEQLGQKDCSLFAELETKHPNAAADVRTRARAMKQRQGC